MRIARTMEFNDALMRREAEGFTVLLVQGDVADVAAGR